MNPSDFFKELRKKEIEVFFSSGKLKYSGPEGNITPDIIEKLKKYKQIIIKYLLLKEKTNLMPINAEGDKTPLFFVHGDRGYYPISEYLGKNQPVYGFFHLGSEGEKIPFKSINEMAKAYLDKILALYPSGPYYLMGQSFGGHLAFEMAVQLQNSGYEVPVLILIDCNNPLIQGPIEQHRIFFKFIRKNILSSFGRSLERFIKILIVKSFIAINKPIPVILRKFYVFYKYGMLLKKFKPKKFKGDMLLFKTNTNKSTHKYLGWDTLAGTIKMVIVDADHVTIFDDKKSLNIVLTEIEKYLTNIEKLKYIKKSN